MVAARLKNDEDDNNHSMATPASEPTVLFVDDEAPVLKAMTRFSRGRGWNVLTALSGQEGLALLADQQVDVVVSDMRMPGMTGDIFLAKIKQQYPDVIRILLTGHADVKALENAINHAGIYNYINKPWDDHLLGEVIQGALRFQESERERKRLEDLTRKQNRQLGRLALSLDKTVKERTIEIEQALTLLQMTHERSKKSFHDALSVVTQLLDWNEGRANNHCRFVAELAQKTATAMKLSEDDVELTQTAGLLHDIGLMALPENLRKKPVYDMTDEEVADYQQHPILAEMALSAASGLEAVAKVVKQHHEHVDGKGFPDGLRGTAVSMPARIIAVVADYHDLYHGLLARQCLGHEDAKAHLQKKAGTTYDIAVVNAFLSLLGDQNREHIHRFKATVAQLKEGMLLDQDLHASNKLLLLTEGTVITRNIIDRLVSYQRKFDCKFELMVKGDIG
ncbi:HD domain-containing phosphohydrolase [Marinagarivorans cellulosilyticus]|uniref:Uncharacterized protein n=1 Tax=Marinagarivorans cellulosilyticus TaxID=2721545 RepID=A0AAN2BKM1_9GAMM|nr:HD domain-containing phosphohydrolase [Marinagarivorans cellulosilyticus]BCD98179.1 hypothetical protein MARGE09_P2380 [Marinagarivorans cellulosilyticus]